MSIGVLHGQNGGNGGLAIRVVGSSVRPESPKDGIIWVNTDQKITVWAMRSDAPENPIEGMLWLTITAEPVVNALKKNEISVKPIRAKQYIGGMWYTKSSEFYADGGWRVLKVAPDFTYTGEYQLVNDADEEITDTTDGNWKIRFLTSGTLTFSQLNGAENGIDVFLVGGGAGGSYSAGTYSGGQGGGGGYTKTETISDLQVGAEYEIIIGAGGAAGESGSTLAPGGESSAFGLSANGASGMDGGSGGGGHGYGKYGNGGNGGSDGSDGTANGHTVFGKGQGSTTREFGEADATLYSGGGGGERGYTDSAAGTNGIGGAGGGGNCHSAGQANTGGGGGACAAGGSGIVIIRNARGTV